MPESIKVDVPLKWNDFSWALEELRHRLLYDNNQDRDWFRLNPIEIFFLGCQAFCHDESATQRVGTVVISMENITIQLSMRPRLFQWILEVLLHQISEEVTSMFLFKRCVAVLIDLLQKALSMPQLHLWVLDLIDEKMDFIMSLEAVQSYCRDKKIALRQDWGELKYVKRQTADFEWISFGNELDSFWLCMDVIAKDFTSTQVKSAWSFLYVSDLLSALNQAEDSGKGSYGKLFILFHAVLSHAATHEFDSMHCASQNGLALRNESDTRDVMPGVVAWEDHKKIVGDPKICQVCIAYRGLFADLTDFIRTCSTSFEPSVCVPGKLLSYLAVETLNNILPSDDKVMAVESLNLCNMLGILLAHSSMGHSVSDAALIMSGFLDMLTCAAEMGMSRNQVLCIHLPNLLSAGFGNMSAEVMKSLLQYGSCALSSKQGKSLLGQSLWFIQRVFMLFPPVDQISSENAHVAHRIEGLLAAEEVLNFILDEIACDRSRSEGKPFANISSEGEPHVSDHPNVGCDDKLLRDVVSPLQVDPMTQSGKEVHVEDLSAKASLLKTFVDLATAMIKLGHNVNYTFASILPRLFYRTDYPEIPCRFSLSYFPDFVQMESSVPWKVEKLTLAQKLIPFCIECLSKSTCSPFQICGVMVPKLVKNLDSTGLSDSVKMNILIEFIEVGHSKLLSSQRIEALLSHGLDLMSLLMPQNATENEVKIFIGQMTNTLEKFAQTSCLLMLKTSCEFMFCNFKADAIKTRELFLHLIKKANRNDIRNLFLISHAWFVDTRFDGIRKHLYRLPSGKLKAKQLQALCEILTTLNSIEKKLVADFADDDRYIKPRKVPLPIAIAKPVLDLLSTTLDNEGFDLSAQRTILSRVAQLSLIHVLFKEKLEGLCADESVDAVICLESELPSDVVSNREFMELLQTTAKRIENMQVPRYEALRKLLVDFMKSFLLSDLMINDTFKGAEANFETSSVLDTQRLHRSNGVEQEVSTNFLDMDMLPSQDLQAVLSRRISNFERFLTCLPRNLETTKRLVALGYKPELWTQSHHISVTTDGVLDFEENLRQTLLIHYGGYCELLLQLGVGHVLVDGAEVKLEHIFAEDFSLTDLKGRRALVVKVIDQHVSKSQQTRILEKKAALLVEEERLECAVEQQASLPLKLRTFAVRLNASFFECVKCCGSQIVGCYSPNGDHCEKVMEAGFRADSAFASIYDEEGTEVENSELLFTDQGVYVYKAYSNGHPHDTSEVWLQFFVELLDRRQVVPAIILPYHFPNRQTWEAARRFVAPEITGSVITCEFDFCPEWHSYYDSRPESVRSGKDIVLLKGFQTSGSISKLFRRQTSHANKDFAGIAFEFVMQRMMENSEMKRFRFLGNFIAAYLNCLIDTGRADETILATNFDFDRWAGTGSGHAGETSKEQILQKIRDFIKDSLASFFLALDVEEMFEGKLRQFLQMWRYLEKAATHGSSHQPFRSDLLRKVLHILHEKLRLAIIEDFPAAFQEELMHWIFGNEDRVWRFRGGRDGYETLQQYLAFLGHIRCQGKHKCKKAFPGVVVHLNRRGSSPSNLRISDVVAYAVGEYTSERDLSAGDDGVVANEDEPVPPSVEPERCESSRSDVYEIVTAFVDPRFRGLHLSTEMYLEVFKSTSATFVAFDMLENSVTSVVSSSPVLRLLERLKLSRFFVHARAPSYGVRTEWGTEQFEKVVVRRRPISACLKLYQAFSGHSFALTMVVGTLAVLLPYYFRAKISSTRF